MAVYFSSHEDWYQPRTTDEPIEISVVLGDGQPGAYMIFLDQDLKSMNKVAVIKRNQPVIGKKIIISAAVVDVLNATNWTSITVFIKEGDAEPKNYGPYRKEAPADLDTIAYLISIIITGHGQ